VLPVAGDETDTPANEHPESVSKQINVFIGPPAFSAFGSRLSVDENYYVGCTASLDWSRIEVHCTKATTQVQGSAGIIRAGM
jgi:hypothetical protein